MRTRSRIVVLPALVMAIALPLHAQRQTAASVAAIHQWVDAVNQHVPGQPDDAVRAIVAMTYRARRDLDTSYSLFMRVLRERDVVVTRSEMDRAVARLARVVRADPGPAVFLKRAAVLHADAVVFARRFPRPPDDAPAPPSRRTESVDGRREIVSAEPPAPLLTNRRVTITRDGLIIGDGPADWNLPFARTLLDELLRPTVHSMTPIPCSDEVAEALRRAGKASADCVSGFVGTPPVTREDREFVAAWYHAIAAYLFAMGMNGDSTDHLHQAARVLPDDPRLLFDRGTYAEWFGLPIYQAVKDEAATNPYKVVSGIPAEDKTNAEAERLYRRALEVDPSYVEARVRLARLLDRRGRHDDAAMEIGRALAARPAGVVGFYARIVAGRIASARGRHEEALQHYREASSIYARAQSALLGASHAALMLADVSQTLAPLQDLPDDQGAPATDPWWDYQLGAGRDVNALLAALWARITK
jgi:tetratricopeptide (TPR) repeat protein